MQVSSATATFAMTFSASMSVIEYYLLKRFRVPCGNFFSIQVSVDKTLNGRNTSFAFTCNQFDVMALVVVNLSVSSLLRCCGELVCLCRPTCGEKGDQCIG